MHKKFQIHVHFVLATIKSGEYNTTSALFENVYFIKNLHHPLTDSKSLYLVLNGLFHMTAVSNGKRKDG